MDHGVFLTVCVMGNCKFVFMFFFPLMFSYHTANFFILADDGSRTRKVLL